jgi:hypothetical protein
VRVYFDTGIFIDYLSTRGAANALLRSAKRRGRTPEDIAADAECLGRMHSGATSCLTYYEVEEALYHMLAQSAKGVSWADTFLIPAARSITTQVQIVVELFNISVLDLTSESVRLQLRQFDLQTRRNSRCGCPSCRDGDFQLRRPSCIDRSGNIESRWKAGQSRGWEDRLCRYGSALEMLG